MKLEYGTTKKDILNIFYYKYESKEIREGNTSRAFKLELDEDDNFIIKGIKDVYVWSNKTNWTIK